MTHNVVSVYITYMKMEKRITSQVYERGYPRWSFMDQVMLLSLSPNVTGLTSRVFTNPNAPEDGSGQAVLNADFLSL